MKSVDEVTSLVSRWILAEEEPVTKMAYIMANTRPCKEALRPFLTGMIRHGWGPAVEELRAALDEGDLERVRWEFVGIDLCVGVGMDLSAEEIEGLTKKLADYEAALERNGSGFTPLEGEK